MKKLTVERTPQLSISTITRNCQHYLLKQFPGSTGQESAEQLRLMLAALAEREPYWLRQRQYLPLRFTTTPCARGGVRYWLVCPACEKRVGKLYAPQLEDKFLCRCCHNLTYTSAQRHNNRVNRAYRRIRQAARVGREDIVQAELSLPRGPIRNSRRLARLQDFSLRHRLRWQRERMEEETYLQTVGGMLEPTLVNVVGELKARE
jgi:hypothetical protein